MGIRKVCMHACVCMCMCACVREREREMEGCSFWHVLVCFACDEVFFVMYFCSLLLFCICLCVLIVAVASFSHFRGGGQG